MKRIALSLLLALLAIIMVAVPVLADTPDPNPPGPSMEDINIYRNVLETGDQLMIIYANIPYDPLPDTPVTQTFTWRLMDGGIELGSTLGTDYNDDGYGYNIYSMYWTAAEVIANGMVWGDVTYQARLSGNPVVFDTPPVYNFNLNAGMYTALTVQSDVQAAIAALVLTTSADLDNKWGLTAANSLLTENETATVLSVFGESFWRGAVNGLQAMSPTIFSVIVTAIDLDERTWDTEYSENVTTQWAGTWIETATTAGGVLFGTDYDFLSLLLLLGMCGGIMWLNLSLTGDTWNGFVDVAVVSIIGARLGMYDLGLLILIAAFCWIYISAKIWFGLIR